MASLIGRKLLQQATPATRRFLQTEAHGSTDMLKYMTWIGVPAVVGLTAFYVYTLEKEHKAHYVRPEYQQYAHLGIRTKAFPWRDGKQSLFHNPKANPIPGEGYEED